MRRAEPSSQLAAACGLADPGGSSSVTHQGPKVGRRHVDSGAGRGLLLWQDYPGQVRLWLAESLAVLAIDSGHSWLVTNLPEGAKTKMDAGALDSSYQMTGDDVTLLTT